MIRRGRDACARLLPLVLALASPAAWPVEEWEVSAGTTGVLVEDHRVPLVDVRVEFAAGTWMPWFREAHAEEAFEIQLHDSAGRLRRRADELALSIDLDAGARSSEIRLSCRKDDLRAALGLVREVLANRDFDRGEISRRKAGRRIGWKASLKEPGFVLDQAMARQLFERADPRREPLEKPRPVLADAERLAAARDALVRLPGRVIGFAGDLTLEEARSLASDLLPPASDAALAGLEPALGPITPAAARPTGQALRLPRLTQAYFAYGRESLSFHEADYPASMIADHVLGGHFNSRLMVALRHEGGETYGAAVENGGGHEPGPYALTTFTRLENATATEQKLRAVLARFHAEGITEGERAAAAGSLVGSRSFARQSPGQLLGEYLWERRLGLPHGFKDDLSRSAASLGLDDVNAFIARFYDPALFTMLRLAP